MEGSVPLSPYAGEYGKVAVLLGNGNAGGNASVNFEGKRGRDNSGMN